MKEFFYELDFNMGTTIIRKLLIKVFHIENVSFSNKFAIKKNELCIQNNLETEQPKEFHLVDVSILKPDNHNKNINTIMDIIPISTKVLGEMGEGITHTLTGVYVILTGAFTNNKQMHEFGTSQGILSEKLYYGRAGTPSKNDILIHINITVKETIPFNRNICSTIFRYADEYIQHIRNLLKVINGKNATEVHEYVDKISCGKPKVVLVKAIAAQGAMYDNQLFPNEPSGYAGGVSIIDMKSMPIILTPNEYRDGIIRAMV